MSKSVFRHPHVDVKACEYGWGVFAMQPLPTNTLVERAPFLIIDAADGASPPLNDYLFTVTDNPRSKLRDQLALVLGWGSLYNHADAPNVQHLLRLRSRLFEFVTSRPVLAGEQLYVSYGPSWWEERARMPR